uniref:DUF1064 domain-containing protein n=1 Tax=Mycena chlorophos TaxID=658473 RepID=A0ABQ0L1N7_MYCCL|nr:predicted protein [Mycena chlorophos]
MLPQKMREMVAAQGKSAPREPATKPSKYNNKPTTVDGIRFDSKKEARYYEQLKIRQRTGEVHFWLRQVPMHLADGTKYIVDFLVFFKDRDRDCEFVDVKGKETQVFRLKKKAVPAVRDIGISAGRIFLASEIPGIALDVKATLERRGSAAVFVENDGAVFLMLTRGPHTQAATSIEASNFVCICDAAAQAAELAASLLANYVPQRRMVPKAPESIGYVGRADQRACTVKAIIRMARTAGQVVVIVDKELFAFAFPKNSDRGRAYARQYEDRVAGVFDHSISETDLADAILATGIANVDVAPPTRRGRPPRVSKKLDEVAA